MRRNSWLLLLMVIFASSLFAHDGEIKIEGRNRYKSIRLAPQIYNNANSNLSDILIKDSSGENVPYFINSSLPKKGLYRETYSLMLINSYLKDEHFYFDYKLAGMRDSDIIATSLELSSRNTGFAKTVNVYGSYDDINWEFVQRDMLYAIDDKSKLNIDFGRPQKYTHYRLELSNNLEQISFNKAELVYNIKMTEENWFIESLNPQFSVGNDDTQTIISIEGLKNLRLCDLTIHSGSMFVRTAFVYSATALGRIKKEIFNLSINGTSCADTTLPLNRYVSTDNIYKVTIANGDDKPINITGISVRYYADDIVFEGKASQGNETYTLEFGANPSQKAPVYDIERYKDEILKGEIDRLRLGALHFAESQEPHKTFPVKIIFNTVIIIISLLLGLVIVLRLKKN